MLGSTTDQTSRGINHPSDSAQPQCGAALEAKKCPSNKPQRRLAPLPPQVIEELRLAYVGTVREVSANLKRIAARSGIPKPRLKYEAWRRGWRCTADRRPWRPEELQYLIANLGSESLKQIARSLKRSWVSVELKAAELNSAGCSADGYGIRNLCQCFGLHHGRIEGWIRRGLLGKVGGGAVGGAIRFPESSIVRFIRKHPCEYDLARVDQVWFKAMVFGGARE